ncbi:hypothetical protein BDV98DRAFT_606078 [Pterulicium gracile]|uniref:Ubiquitin 3 binding protein But2 C-terminal domain-containing protein n=1 Tax=Pterulicium gracile TaxID=1884261 RepID=A0A5C3QHC2_9AGAR|nr:hypothetical protein BDV98DRAFT_606078 [Pterula gracilis]
MHLQTLTSFLLTAASAAFALTTRQTAPQTCTTTTAPGLFTLTATYTTSPYTTVPLRVANVHTVAKVGYALLTTGPGPTTWPSYNLASSVFKPYPGNTIMRTVSLPLNTGESPSFISIQTYPPGWAGYCFMDAPTPSTGPQLLAAHTHSDKWALCANSTAGGRVDIVYDPVPGHAHYTAAGCVGVTIEVVPV